MIDVNYLVSYAKRLKEHVDDINFNTVIVDESQMVNFIQEVSVADNHLLFAVLPDFSSSGNSASLEFKTETIILVLQKCSYSDLDHEEFLDVMQGTLLSARSVVQKMLDDHEDFTTEGCPFMKQLNTNSIRIIPVWGKSGCSGWSIEFNFDSPF